MSTADSRPTIREVDLGAEDSFGEVPAEVTVGLDNFFLTRDKDGAYHLLSAICPHQWGRVVKWDTCFMCPTHGWRFEMGAGECINGPRSRMYSFTVTVKDGRIFAQIPRDKRQWG